MLGSNATLKLKSSFGEAISGHPATSYQLLGMYLKKLLLSILKIKCIKGKDGLSEIHPGIKKLGFLSGRPMQNAQAAL